MRLLPSAQLSGGGWSLSVQRWRTEPRSGLSSNLGAAPLALLDPEGRTRRLAVRLAHAERVWLALLASADWRVLAILSDGRRLADDMLGDGEPVVHRLGRVAGEQEEGLGPPELRVLPDLKAEGYSIALTLQRRTRVHVRILAIEESAFDAAFGPHRDVEGPAAYGGWRLP
jgi:hypothetical protein